MDFNGKFADYDYIIAGAGASGLLLLDAILHSSLSGKRIALLDPDTKQKNDRTWCYADSHGVHKPYVADQWNTVGFYTEDEMLHKKFPARKETTRAYYRVEGIDFYNYSRQQLSKFPNVDFIQETLEKTYELPNGVLVKTDRANYRAEWLFDSSYRMGEKIAVQYSDIYLLQHFQGWVIESKSGLENICYPILMDFRPALTDKFHFFYVLPITPKTALVEYTLFSEIILTEEDYRQGLIEYIENNLRIKQYKIKALEAGVIPMTTHKFERLSAGGRVLKIGTMGGLIRPSTGYGFKFFTMDADRIVQSLQENNHPYGFYRLPLRFGLYDLLFLRALHRDKNQMRNVFKELFRHNNIDVIFDFMDGQTNLLQEMRIFSRLPKWPFIKALFTK